MILDDEPLLLSLLTRTFNLWGHEVEAYPHPVVCPLFTVKLCPCKAIMSCPDVILTDFDMPHVNGIEFLEAVTQKTCRCHHLALMTGKSFSDAMLVRAEKMNVKFFTKPFQREYLKTWLDGLQSMPQALAVGH